MHENNEIKYLKLEDIIPNRAQPRTEFDIEKLNELANSIKQYGIINPIIVRSVGNKYEIIAGERRYKASKIAGLTTIPVIISNIDDNTSAEIAIIENIQRQDLTALEEAKAYRKLLDQGNITQEKLAQKMGKSQSTIANKMRLLNLCDEVQEALENHKITERHARSLLQLKNVSEQREMLDRIIDENLTVKNTETAIKEKIQSKNLNSQKEVIDLSIVPSPILNENIYGNDVVSIMDLNKKEIEKDFDNMNNEQNIQMNQGVMPTPTLEQPMIQPTAPAFGDRFFPSLEDQETNINLNNPFEAITQVPPVQPTAQPMMENLVEQPMVAPVAAPIPQVQPVMQPVMQPEPMIQPEPIAPVAPPVLEPTINVPQQPEPIVAIPSFVTNNQTAPVIEDLTSPTEINLPPMLDISTPNPVTEQIPQASFVQNIPTPSVAEPVINEPIIANNNIVAEPIINPINYQSQEISPFAQVVQESMVAPVAEPIPQIQPLMQPEPVMQPEPIAPVAPPVLEPTMNILNQPSTIVEQPIIEQPVLEPLAPVQPELPVSTPEYKPTDNIINAINALKNLGLSIGSIGYKVTLDEEDTPNSYRITIEIEK